MASSLHRTYGEYPLYVQDAVLDIVGNLYLAKFLIDPNGPSVAEKLRLWIESRFANESLFVTYIRRMAKNRILDRIRHAKIGPGAGVSPNSFTHSHDKPPHDKLVDKERGERLVRNVESNLKNSKSREVFVLWMHGFTAKEIADILGVDVLSIYRMKRQIREVVFLIVENDFES